MARKTVWVSDELMERMEKANKTEDVNWSQVAATAFEVKLAEVAARKEKKTMEDVIQRLKASKLKAESNDYREGNEAGIEWAKGKAEWFDLVLLALGRKSASFENLFEHEEFGGAHFFSVTLEPEGGLSENALAGLFGDRIDSPHYVRGFWEGAVEVHDEVKGKL